MKSVMQEPNNLKTRPVLSAIIFLFLVFAYQNVFTQSITKTVGGIGADYATVKLAFDDINSGTITDTVILQITGNTTETSPAILYETGTGSSDYAHVLIYPTGTYSISGNISTNLILLDGADQVIIDGRINATGSSRDLSFINTYVGANASTIKITNSGEYNTIKYCILKGSGTGTGTGVVNINNSAAAPGNRYDLIDNNEITCAADANRPVNGVLSTGSSGIFNSEITISNNIIYNFLNSNQNSSGVHVGAYTHQHTITNNSVYETTTVSPTSNIEFYGIRINYGSGDAHTINGNYIGGTSANCGGGTFTKSNTANNPFYGIYLNAANANTTNIQGNTIQKIDWQNNGSADFHAIYASAGKIEVGTTTANTIGQSTGTGSINFVAGATGATFYGIRISVSGITNCENNIIGSITASNSSENATNFYGIIRTGSYITSISNNIIGSTTTSNSINISSESTLNAQSVYGIYSTNTSSNTFNNNTVCNLTNATTNTTAATTGSIIGMAIANGACVISDNIVKNLTIANANNSSSNTASIIGLALTGNYAKTTTGNQISNLSNTYASFEGYVIGIYYVGNTGTNIVERNIIHSLSVNSSSSNANINGIRKTAGLTRIANNIITIGGNTNTNITGVYEYGVSGNSSLVYHNSIIISGSLSSGSTNTSYCIYSDVSTNIRDFRNNILFNTRSTTSGSDLHYGIYLNYAVTTNLTLNYNDYYVTGTGGNLGYYNSASVNTLPLIAGFDGNSINEDPDFANATGTSSADFEVGYDKLAGFYISTVTTDFNSDSRLGTPTMGALEGNLSLNLDLYQDGNFASSYNTLKEAFDKINSSFHTGNIELRIKNNITETVIATLNSSGTYTSVKIFPTVSNLVIDGNLNTRLIYLDGADNVTIDGRVNQAGTTKSLTIRNTNAGTLAITIRLQNSAENNTVKYCYIEGSGLSTALGTIYIGGASSGNGNDNNLITNNTLTSSSGGRPMQIMYAAGSVGFENDNNIFSENHVYNFFNPNIALSYGVQITNYNTNFQVTNNHFYETTVLAPAKNTALHAIRINTQGCSATGNYIGGTDIYCGGTPMTLNSSFPYYFLGIWASGSTSPITIENNVVKNMDITSKDDNPWDGIFINSGNIDVIGNTIGATTGNGSITVKARLAVATATITGDVITGITLIDGGSGYTIAPTITFQANVGGSGATATANLTGDVVTSITLTDGGSGFTSAPSVYFDAQNSLYSTSHGMIVNSPGTVNIVNNTIGSITTVGSDYYAHGFESVYVRGVASTVTFDNNLIGSLTTANSINTSSSAHNAITKQDVYGIYSTGTGTTVIQNNTIANLTNAYSGNATAARSRGITASSGTNSIIGNTVRDITSSSSQTSTVANAPIIGIFMSSSNAGLTQIVRGNTVYNISSLATTPKIELYGIYYSGNTTAAGELSDNFVRDLSLSSTNTASTIHGVFINGGSLNAFNNVIALGEDISTGYLISGIYDIAGTATSKTYHNTIAILGSVSGTTSNTYAFWNNLNTSTRDFSNNIFYNQRSGGTTGKHYAIRLSGTSNLTINYNDYFVSGTGGVLGYLGSDRTSLANWQTATGQDANSLNKNPDLELIGGIEAGDYRATATNLASEPIAIVDEDYDGTPRSDYVCTIGAFEMDEEENTLPVELLYFIGNCDKNEVNLNWTTATETNNKQFDILRSIDLNSWEKIGEIKGAGNSNVIIEYKFTDSNPVKTGQSYYRLKQIDFNGNTNFSNTISSDCQSTEKVFNVFPNPSSGVLNIEVNDENLQSLLQIYTLDGKQVYQTNIIENFTLIQIEHLQKGIYSLVLLSENGNSSVKKLVVN